MSKIPKKPDDIFEDFTNDFKNILGNDLIAIILYGSAARGEYIYKRSDINFLVVLSEQGIQNLRSALNIIPKWKKRKVSTPLILTEEYIHSALDSFPIEFLTMKHHYQVVFGKDVLSDLEIKNEHMRLQCERELRSKLIYLRENYLNTKGKPHIIKQLFNVSISAFTSIFSALLELKKTEVPSMKQQIFSTTAEIFNLNNEVFDNIFKLQEKKSKLKKEEVNELMEQYIDQIRKLTNLVDEL